MEKVPESDENFIPGSISIKEDIKEDSEEKELVEIFDKASDEFKNASPIEKEALDSVWKSMAESLTDQPVLQNTLSSSVPAIGDDYVLELEVRNDIQREKVNSSKQMLVPGLRDKLGNRFITLNVTVNTASNENIKPATPAEKFTSLAGKNPALIDLQKKFGLEPNY